MTADKAAPASGSVLVVGGGISGLTTALETAEVGYEVFLVEKNPYLGGRVAQLNQYFPKLCPPTCGLEINFRRIKDNPKIKIFTLAEVQNVEGIPGNYDVQIKLNLDMSTKTVWLAMNALKYALSKEKMTSILVSIIQRLFSGLLKCLFQCAMLLMERHAKDLNAPSVLMHVNIMR